MAIDILLFAEQFHGVLPDQDSEGMQRVQDCWRKWPVAATLLVIDNAPSFAEIKSILPPVRAQFKVLLTSRSRFESPVDNYEIRVLSLEASIDLLQRLLQDQRIDRERQRAEEICGYLGYLPLALELVGRYLQKRPDLSLATVDSKFYPDLAGDRHRSRYKTGSLRKDQCSIGSAVGGCRPISRSAARIGITRSRFNNKAETVALPIAVKPMIIKLSTDQIK
jgi:hypothetical protein